MKYLLFEGTSNVGKTTVIIRFANNLINKHGYICVNGNVPATGSKNDSKAVLKNINAKSGYKRISINSTSDYPETLDEYKNFANLNAPYDIVISSCRMEQKLYSYFSRYFQLTTAQIKFLKFLWQK